MLAENLQRKALRDGQVCAIRGQRDTLKVASLALVAPTHPGGGRGALLCAHRAPGVDPEVFFLRVGKASSIALDTTGSQLLHSVPSRVWNEATAKKFDD